MARTNLPHRYVSGKIARKVSTRHPRVAWRVNMRHKKTAAEKAALKAKRNDHRELYAEALAAANKVVSDQARILHERFGRHSLEYYFKELLQHCHLKKGKRRPSRWNAYVKKETWRINSELPPGTKRHKATEVMMHIKASWKVMSEEERISATDDVIHEIEETREMKAFAPHNVMLNAFHDGQKSLHVIDEVLTKLHSRTGMEFIFLGVRNNTEYWNQPHVFYTQRAADLFENCFKTSVSTIAFRFEGYCIAGIQGLAKTHMDEVLELKRKLSERILRALQDAAAPAQVNRMYYVNFDESITAKYQIIIENWPLTKFCSPGDLGSRNELRVLFHAWESNATRFRKLSSTEFKKWEADRFNATMARSSGSDSPSPNDSPNGSFTPPHDGEPPAERRAGSATDTPSAGQHPASVSSPSPSQTAAEPRGEKRPSDGLTGVFSANGDAVHIAKKTRKERADKGKKRGPRKNKTQATTPTDPSASSPPASSPPASLPSTSQSAASSSSPSASSSSPSTSQSAAGSSSNEASSGPGLVA